MLMLFYFVTILEASMWEQNIAMQIYCAVSCCHMQRILVPLVCADTRDARCNIHTTCEMALLPSHISGDGRALPGLRSRRRR